MGLLLCFGSGALLDQQQPELHAVLLGAGPGPMLRAFAFKVRDLV